MLFYYGDRASGSATIEGTVSPAAAGDGDLLCYTSATTPFDLADGIAVSATGSFAADVSLSVIHGQACVLRFVPSGTTPTPNVAAASFLGPAVSVSDQYSHATNGNLYGYDILGGVLAFSYEFGSLGECPIRASFSTDPGNPEQLLPVRRERLPAAGQRRWPALRARGRQCRSTGRTPIRRRRSTR